MTKHVEIENVKGFTLRGYLELPENAKIIVVMFHGFTGNKTEHNGHFRNLSRMLASKNIASLRMDYHGNGESGGEFYDFNFDDAIDDALRMIDFAKKIDGIEKVQILGFSFGGAVASLVANDENCDKLLLWSPAGNMPDITKRRYENNLILENGNCYFSGFEMSKNFVDSIINKNMYKNTSNFTKKVLVIHGRKDTSVPYLYGVRYAVSYYDSRLHIIDKSEHGYNAIEERNELYNESLRFLG